MRFFYFSTKFPSNLPYRCSSLYDGVTSNKPMVSQKYKMNHHKLGTVSILLSKRGHSHGKDSLPPLTKTSMWQFLFNREHRPVLGPSVQASVLPSPWRGYLSASVLWKACGRLRWRPRVLLSRISKGVTDGSGHSCPRCCANDSCHHPRRAPSACTAPGPNRIQAAPPAGGPGLPVRGRGRRLPGAQWRRREGAFLRGTGSHSGPSQDHVSEAGLNSWLPEATRTERRRLRWDLRRPPPRL